jgi:anti-sigma-K factor RskA
MKNMTMNKDELFELDLRAALAPEPASADLRRRVLEQAMPYNQRPARTGTGWKALFDPRSWRIPALVEIGAAAAVASLAVGVFAGASGIVPSGLMLDSDNATTTVASADDSSDGSVDLVTLAYDNTSGIAGDLQ